MTLYKKPLKNIVGNGENAGNQHFLPPLVLFPPPLFCYLLKGYVSCSSMLNTYILCTIAELVNPLPDDKL